MKNKLILKTFTIGFLVLFLFSVKIHSQIHPDFTLTKTIKTSTVKSQDRTGTCWSYATISFIETEALRMGKPELDLSEMFMARHAYTDKAIKYVRYHGNANFSQGGQAHDVMNVIRKHGISTEEAYPGLNYGSTAHNHSELEGLLKGMLDGFMKTSNNKLSTAWLAAFNAAIEVYLGKTPAEINFQGKKYTPVSFAKDIVGINPDDYIELTSYAIYPYYKKADLEVPDNWSHDLYYNVPIDDLMAIMNHALNNGYSVCWDGDVSEEDFNREQGTAAISLKESDGILTDGIEKMRQLTFDNHTTTDDHLMHITGLATDKNGTVFYLTKNSWGDKSNKYGGYLYMSNSFVQLKTVAIMVHKDAIPKDLRKKLGI
jgi:bleomycin hydrolase